MDYSKQWSPELLARIKQIKLRARKILSSRAAGDYSSPQRGYGFEFHQLREYGPGDDVRFIDWKSSARCGTFMVKETLHERSQNVLIAMDVSNSMRFGSGARSKFDIAKEAMLVLALAAQQMRARVSLLLFADQIVKYIPLQRTSQAMMHILHEIVHVQPQGSVTDLTLPLKQIASMKSEKLLVFLCSDFIAQSFEDELGIVARRHELVAIDVNDRLEVQMPHARYMPAIDVETGSKVFLTDTKKMQLALNQRIDALRLNFTKHKIDRVQLDGTLCVVECLTSFLARRMLRV